MSEKLLNLGCGEFVGAHWLNIDGSPNVLLSQYPAVKRLLKPVLPASAQAAAFQNVHYRDLRKSWSWEDNSVDGIYSSHFFEHLSLSDGRHVLKEAFRVLKPGGRIRFVVPSLEAEITQYLEAKNHKDALAASKFAESVNVFTAAPRGPWWYRLYFALYDKNSHKMFYDFDSLKSYFQAAGFTAIESKDFLQSELPYLKEIEQWYKVTGSVCLEAQKPLSAVKKTGT